MAHGHNPSVHDTNAQDSGSKSASSKARLNDGQKQSAHTPGPWEYRRDGDRHYVAYGICQIVEAAWGTIEADDFGSSKANSQEREANARLIAAAPDMLAALKQAEAFVIAWAASYQYQHELKAFHEKHQETFDLTRAAIAKAEGR